MCLAGMSIIRFGTGLRPWCLMSCGSSCKDPLANIRLRGKSIYAYSERAFLLSLCLEDPVTDCLRECQTITYISR